MFLLTRTRMIPTLAVPEDYGAETKTYRIIPAYATISLDVFCSSSHIVIYENGQKSSVILTLKVTIFLFLTLLKTDMYHYRC